MSDGPTIRPIIGCASGVLGVLSLLGSIAAFMSWLITGDDEGLGIAALALVYGLGGLAMAWAMAWHVNKHPE